MLQDLRDEWLASIWAHQELRRLTFRRYYLAIHLEKIAVRAQRKAKRLSQRDDASLLVLLTATFKEMSRAINKDTRRLEDKLTKEAIRKTLASNRSESEYFYLCSYHNDCAEDHLPYQGKVYVDERAPDRCGFKTLQWALGAPAYLITRPNCRHYFVVITKEEAMTKTADELLNKKHLRSDIGSHTAQNNELQGLLRRMYVRRPSAELKKAFTASEKHIQ